MKAFHSNWSKPFYRLNSYKEYYIDDFEILTTMLSALKWREKNGKIKMITDSVGAEYYKKLNIESIWDEGIYIGLDKIDNEIDSNIFWAAGKLYALKDVNMPAVMMDTDFIVWENVNGILESQDVCVIHKEDIIKEVYPNRDYFRFNNEYEFDNQWDWDVLPCNTAFTYIKSNEFKEFYVSSAIEFMKNIKYGNNRIVYMVFAEQRLISMCAEKVNMNIGEFMSLKKLYGEQKYFTHIWGYKEMMRNDANKREDFCIKCVKRLIKDYPEYEGIIANMAEINKYYKLIKNEI